MGHCPRKRESSPLIIRRLASLIAQMRGLTSASFWSTQARRSIDSGACRRSSWPMRSGAADGACGDPQHDHCGARISGCGLSNRSGAGRKTSPATAMPNQSIRKNRVSEPVNPNAVPIRGALSQPRRGAFAASGLGGCLRREISAFRLPILDGFLMQYFFSRAPVALERPESVETRHRRDEQKNHFPDHDALSLMTI